MPPLAVRGGTFASGADVAGGDAAVAVRPGLLAAAEASLRTARARGGTYGMRIGLRPFVAALAGGESSRLPGPSTLVVFTAGAAPVVCSRPLAGASLGVVAGFARGAESRGLRVRGAAGDAEVEGPGLFVSDVISWMESKSESRSSASRLRVRST